MSDQHPEPTTPPAPDAEPLPETPPALEPQGERPLPPDAEPLPSPEPLPVAEPADTATGTAAEESAGSSATTAAESAAADDPEELPAVEEHGIPARPGEVEAEPDVDEAPAPTTEVTGPPDQPLPFDPLAADDVDEGPAPLGDDELDSALEALLLVVDSPVEEEALAGALDVTPLRVAEHLRLLSNRYADQDRGIDLRRAGGGWRFYTRDRYAPYVEKLLLDGQRAKLTRAALETLAVIAYRQPVTRARVAAVRGVNCDGVIRTLLARGLVEETGTDQETGGFLYRTTELFLERLGLSSLEDLPPIAPLLPEVDSIDEL